jgi:hypothetical protein
MHGSANTSRKRKNASMAKIDKKPLPLELAQHFDESPERIENVRCKVSYQFIVWSAVVWVAVCVAPYVYALNDLTTWP